jgi:membrane associated rhomboid family serine protease
MDSSAATPPRPAREPIFNLPPVITAAVFVLLLIHGLREFASRQDEIRLLLAFAYIPARYADLPNLARFFPPDDPARWWTPVTYFFLHGGWDHVILNSLWLAVFGSAVAWRFGTARFLLMTALGTVAGAAAHQAFHGQDVTPMVGASAGISALTAAAIRFVFEAGGPLGAFRQRGRLAFLAPATPFLASLKNPQVLGFVAVWFALNLLFGFATLPGVAGEGAVIAWEAHVGGFLAGLLAFPLLDTVPRRR